LAISRRHGDLAREVGQGEIAHRLVVQLAAAARRGPRADAVVGEARIGQAREDVVVGEDEPLARRGVELDGLVLAMACVPHPREI